MTTSELDITPDPKVLIALTHTPLKPLDALCELIDNAIDSFRSARLEGSPEPHPLIRLNVPGEAEVRRGDGIVRVLDNGSGLDRDGLEQALRVGFSGKNRYDTLGLFGMGFNIATGKLGQRTTVITAKRNSDHALKVELDLMAIVGNRSFVVPVEQIDKPEGLTSGTWVSIDRWWPEGSANSGFIVQLARISKPQLSDQVGRRYATLLRRAASDRAQIRLNGDSVPAFEHCVWSAERFVERQGWGMIAAQETFDQVLATQQRCKSDGALRSGDSTLCVECGGSEFTSVEERIHGWVGIQRYDDMNRFGVDLIRNGRAIRLEEKDAFSNYADELGAVSREYPIDGQFGRLVGEVHLDRVPVDFGKQDFQRSSEEWIRSIEYLRGESLLPSKWADGDRNLSPVSKLFQGYRRVRNYGRQDMYMGRFDAAQNKPVRIGRELEQEYLERFRNREDGYHDDAQWWELVESATIPPVEPLDECPECGYSGLPGAEVCEGCTAILKGKDCLDCAEQVPVSTTVCPHCGTSQIPDVEEPWTCSVCSTTNEVDTDVCVTCSAIRGTLHPLSEESLVAAASPMEDLSFEDRRFPLAGGQSSAPIDVAVFRTGTLRPTWDGPTVPAVSLKRPGAIRIFVDPSHDAFVRLGVALQEVIAIEAAQYLHRINSQLESKPEHSVLNIAATVIAEVWGDELGASPEEVAEGCEALFAQIAELVPTDSAAMDFYEDLDTFETRELADRLITLGKLEQLSDMRADGSYIRFVGPSVLARFFESHPDSWFGPVWAQNLPTAEQVGPDAAARARDQITGVVSRCLDDCAGYLRYRETTPLILARVRAAKEYLDECLA